MKLLLNLVRKDFNSTAKGGVYGWDKVKELIKGELGWADGNVNDKSLHTSCKIEKCKDATQLQRFRDMESRVIPYSAIEMSLAVAQGCITRERALAEIKLSSGFCRGCERENKIMTEFFKK